MLLGALENRYRRDEEPEPEVLRTLALLLAYHPTNPDLSRALTLAAAAAERTDRGDAATLADLADVQARADDLDQAVRTLEEALQLPGADPALELTLDGYRTSLAERSDPISSYASLDALIECGGREVLIPAGAKWQFVKRGSSPTEGLAWTETTFDSSDWEIRRNAFGSGLILGVNRHYRTWVTGMAKSNLYLRRLFPVSDPGRIRALYLYMHGRDCVAYLNGPKAADSSDVKAPRLRRNRILPGAKKVRFDAEALSAGDNCLALETGHSVAFYFDAALVAELAPDAASVEEAAEEHPDERIRLYARGRITQESGDPRRAASTFGELVRLDPEAREPRWRLAECRRAAGDLEGAEEAVRGLLARNRPFDRGPWDIWLTLGFIDLGLDAGEMLRRFHGKPTVTRASAPGRDYGDDVLWLLEELTRGSVLRINSGGDRFVTPEGKRWSADRFFADDDKVLGRPPPEPTKVEAVDHRLHQNPAYRIPLPRGQYRVRLRFGDLARRVFDIVAEDRTQVASYETRPGTVNETSFDSLVRDGFLDLSFVERQGGPRLAAIEIQLLED